MTFRQSFLVLTAILSAVCTLSSTPGLAAATQLQGAGATFPYPLYSKWFAEFQKSHPGVEINYQSIGSGGGIRQFLAGTVDFGASDAPMSDEEMSKAKLPVLHIPTALGAVVLTYNLPGVSSGIRLTPEVLADLFLGKIQSWDDGKIISLNPGVKFPKLAVIPVYRSDGSGTTAIFTDYLAKVSPEFKAAVGNSKTVKWPVGLGGKGNEGVTGTIKQTPGALGYVELVYAATNKMPVARVKNASGEFVEPNVESVTAAAAAFSKTIPADFRASITQGTGKKVYPISGMTYVLVYQAGPAEKMKPLKELLNWCLSTGQTMAGALHYAPLPKELAESVKKAIARIAAISPGA